ncbi:MAG TPA: aromatic amino acid lyase, partial [Gaiellaceae bacterium]|nr:aromatic amino acid lyase [Gaiellaceae bacterium]
MAPLRLTGDDLRLDDVWDVAVGRRPAELSERARERMQASRALFERQVGERTYGVTTGFGKLVSTEIEPGQVRELQLRLLRSHACGVGEPYPDE